MKRIIRLLSQYRKEALLSPLFKLLEASFELIIPLIIGEIIDKGISDGVNTDKKLIFSLCGLMVLLGLIGFVCAVTAQYFAAKAAVGVSTQLKHDLFEKLQSLSFTEYDTLGTSKMITRMTGDVGQVQNAVNLVLRLFLRAPVIVIGSMIMAFTVDVKAALIFAVLIPLLSVIVFGIMALTVPIYKKVQSKLDLLLGITRENQNGARVIRAFGREEAEKDRFEKATDELSFIQRFAGRLSSLTNPLTILTVNSAVIVLIYVGALRVNYGDLTKGQVVALYNYMSQILTELVKLANLIISVTKGIASANRIESVFDLSSSLENGSKTTMEKDGEIVFENVSLRYKNAGAPSVCGISFSLKAGETLGIIGGTGSGKSSVVNLIPRFYDATEGKITVGGEDVKNYDIAYLRSKIGIVPQSARLFGGSIRDNLLMGNENAGDEELTEALKNAQAFSFVSEKPGYLDYLLEPSGRNLSGGQKQRLTIARALVRKPSILILDDSASALDYKTDFDLRASISSLSYKPTTVIVSQRASSVLGADKVLVLEDGECAGYGTPEELLKTCDVYREIYYCQFPDERKEAESQ